MGYIIYNIKTTRILLGRNGRSVWQTETAAKAGRTRILGSNPQLGTAGDYAIITIRDYYADVEGKETVKNLMTGKDVVQSVNTPHSCDPSCETFWSM